MSGALNSTLTNADVVVIGAGPAGMAAAVRASESGAKVLVLDDNTGSGGQIWRGGERAQHDRHSDLWFKRFRTSGARLLAGAQVVSAVASNQTLLVETWKESLGFRYKKLIIAAGAREIFLPFPGWTLPGIAGVGGLQSLAKSGLPIAGKSVVIAGSGPLLLAVAASLRKAGAR